MCQSRNNINKRSKKSFELERNSMDKRTKIVCTITLLVILALTLLLAASKFQVKTADRPPQQCKGTIVYIAKDFYTDNFIMYVQLDSAYSAKEKLRLFLVSDETTMYSEIENYSLEDMFSKRETGFYVDIFYRGELHELEDHLWAYPAETVVILSDSESKENPMQN